jgi:hypothetical protein
MELVARFRDNGITYKFVPQKDITSYELALLLPLVNARALQSDGRATQYIIDNNLMKHFVEE